MEQALKHFRNQWIANIRQNIPAIKRSRKLPRRKGPAVVIGAGPGLLKNGTLIPSNIFTIAVDAALPYLDSIGVTVDWVVTIDHSKKVITWLEHGNYRNILACVVSPPGLWKLKKKLYYFAYSGITDIAPDKILTLPGGGNVGNQAWTLAVHLGASPIALIGMDLSVTGGIHYAGINDHKIVFNRSSADGTLLTNDVYMEYAIWLEKNVSSIWKRVKTYNCTEQGIIKIPCIKFKHFIKETTCYIQKY